MNLNKTNIGLIHIIRTACTIFLTPMMHKTKGWEIYLGQLFPVLDFTVYTRIGKGKHFQIKYIMKGT